MHDDERFVCPGCGGDGFKIVEEFGRRFEDACYHCATNGYIGREQLDADRLAGLAGRIAHQRVQEMRKSCNEAEESEGWAFHAAENRMTEYDYTQARIWEEEVSVAEELQKLQPRTLSILLDITNPITDDDRWQPRKPKPPKPVGTMAHAELPWTPPQDTGPGLPSSDDIPF